VGLSGRGVDESWSAPLVQHLSCDLFTDFTFDTSVLLDCICHLHLPAASYLLLCICGRQSKARRKGQQNHTDECGAGRR